MGRGSEGSVSGLQVGMDSSQAEFPGQSASWQMVLGDLLDGLGQGW